ncbi:MAG: type II toxin-antitoxin system CcdA family antitoxin [Myxococcota bacterium]
MSWKARSKQTSWIRSARDPREKAWRSRNARAIAEYNRRVERDGVFSDGLRTF